MQPQTDPGEPAALRNCRTHAFDPRLRIDRYALCFRCAVVETGVALWAYMLQSSVSSVDEFMLPRGDGSNAPNEDASSVSYVQGTRNEKETVMKIMGLIISLTAATALAAFAQEGTVEDVKQGAKKTGQTVKNGLETAGEKTKEAAETVGEKTKETAKTVGRKTKETAQTVGQKTKESAKTVHRKSKKALNKAKTETGSQQSTSQAPNTPAPTDR